MTKLIIFLQSYIATRETSEDRGATMVEYGLIVAAIALVVVVGATVFGDALSSFFSGLADKL
jgi:pilus assembly protein Flp/PilA